MGRELVIRGLPDALVRDSWWFGAAEDGAGAGDGGRAGGGTGLWRGRADRGRAVALLAVVLAGDVLIYGHAPGLSLAIFAAVIFVAAVLDRKAGARTVRGPAAILALSALPVVEYVQSLSVAFLVAGLAIAIAWARLGPAAGPRVLRGAVRLLLSLPHAGLFAAVAGMQTWATGAASGAGLARALRRAMRGWAFPAGGALVLAALLTDANPVLAVWVDRLLSFDVDLGPAIRRGLFWVGTALAVWPLIALPDGALGAAPATGRARRVPGLGINAASVARALVLFNLMMAVQTVLDLRYLWAGGALPEGMSHASYAHRGAYPLLATALLAGAFALAARPFLGERRHLRALVFVWLGQNVLLTMSAVLRLAIYVEAYGLTYLRVHAAIWMALVAAGLILTGWQIGRGRSNRWLIVRSAALGLGVLYGSCFVNFAGLIAAYNLARSDGADLCYICALGPTALPAVRASGVALPCEIDGWRIAGWRDWGFRLWRVQRYLDGVADPEATHEDPGRR